jgi:hypothetical protein
MTTSRLQTFLATAALAAACLAQQPIYHAVQQPAADPGISLLPGGTMLSIPGLFTDFTLAGGGQFVELPGGEARLTGRVFSDSSIYSAFLIDIVFTGKVAPADPMYPPAPGPDLELQAAAYTPVGSIDPAQFTYYTAASGTLTGVRNLDGAVLGVTLGSQPAQYGIGANNRDGELGIQANFDVTILQQPPFNPIGPLTTASVLLDMPLHRAMFATHPQVDTDRSNLAFGRAMVLPGVADDYVFIPAGSFTEYEDGHAELQGTFARTTALDDRWDVAVSLTSRIDPGEVGCPPVGSPVLQMLPSAYVANGGTMDPSHWHYYQVATGTLLGRGLNEGGDISITNSTAVQVGGAANQTNTYHGYYGAFSTNILVQPTARTIAITGDAELFGLNAIFPVLPFPSLTTPATAYSLPTLTDQGLIVEGDNLAWVELVGVGFDLIGGRHPSQWAGGYFQVIDNQHLEVHPRPGAAPGVYNLVVYNPAIVTAPQTLDLTAPVTPQLFSEAALEPWYTQHIYVHSGTVTGPALSAIAMSDSLQPTTFPGVANLGIGDNGQSIVIFPSTYGHDPVTGIARADLVIPPGIWPLLHFQAVTLDLGALVLPLPSTNVWSVTYQ